MLPDCLPILEHTYPSHLHDTKKVDDKPHHIISQEISAKNPSVSSTTINFLHVTKPLNTHRERETLGFLNIEFGIREQE
jgi:hypothetical protein